PDIEDVGIHELLHQPPAFLRPSLVEDHGADAADVRVDRVPQHEHLHDGDEKREEERGRVAENVDQLFAGDGGETLERAEHAASPTGRLGRDVGERGAEVARPARLAGIQFGVGLQGFAHVPLAFPFFAASAWSRRSWALLMVTKTSSSVGSASITCRPGASSPKSLELALASTRAWMETPNMVASRTPGRFRSSPRSDALSSA